MHCLLFVAALNARNPLSEALFRTFDREGSRAGWESPGSRDVLAKDECIFFGHIRQSTTRLPDNVYGS
jgi:hypothetical protein